MFPSGDLSNVSFIEGRCREDFNYLVVALTAWHVGRVLRLPFTQRESPALHNLFAWLHCESEATFVLLVDVLGNQSIMSRLLFQLLNNASLEGQTVWPKVREEVREVIDGNT